MQKIARLLPVLVFCLWSSQANGLEYSGHLKYNLTRTTLDRDTSLPAADTSWILHQPDFRLNLEHHQQYDLVLHYELLATISESGLLSGVSGKDSSNLLDLSSTLRDRRDSVIIHKLDRLSAGYTGDRFVFRIGRQAVSWGNGMVYHPMDIINPYKPTAVDKDYKPGSDLLYGQWLLTGGNDVQLIIQPRRTGSNSISSRQSSFALKYHGLHAIADIDLLAASHYGETTFGIGLVKTIGAALARCDLMTVAIDHAWRQSLVVNIDYSWNWWGYNFYGFGEYFYTSLGSSDSDKEFSPELANRLQRGELFTVDTDYLALGSQIELHPLLLLSPAVMTNLTDGSGLLTIPATWYAAEELVLRFYAILPFGDSDSEYGGRRSPGRSLQIAVNWYF